MKKVICFARVSTLQQSLDEQMNAVIQAAKYDGYEDCQILQVKGKESAITLDEEMRQTLNEIKVLVAEHPTIESIYFFSVDRLARRMSVIMSIKEWADEQKLNLVFLNPHRMATFHKNEDGKKVENEMTSLMLTLLSYGAQMEMKVKKARFAIAKEGMRNNGRLPQGKPAIGYKLDNKRYILIDEEKAELVRCVFMDYLTGNYTLSSLHNKYVAKGLFAASSEPRTHKSRVHTMLNNVAYIGEEVTCNGRTSIKYPSIINRELFEQVQTLLRSRKCESKLHTKHIGFAKTIIRCKQCGRLLRQHANIGVYSCDEKNDHRHNISMNVCDTIAWRTAAEFYNYYIHFDFAQVKKSYEDKVKENQQLLAIIEQQIKTEFNKQEIAFKKLYDGKVKEEIYDKMYEQSQIIMADMTKQQATLKVSITETQRLLENIDNTTKITPRELQDLPDIEKVDIIKKTINTMYIERMDKKHLTKITIIPSDMIAPLVISNEYYIWDSTPNINKLWWVNDKYKVDITNHIERRIQRKNYKRKKK